MRLDDGEEEDVKLGEEDLEREKVAEAVSEKEEVALEDMLLVPEPERLLVRVKLMVELIDPLSVVDPVLLSDEEGLRDRLPDADHVWETLPDWE